MEIREGVHLTPRGEIFVDWFCLRCGQRHRISEIKPRCANCGQTPSGREKKGIAQSLSLGKRVAQRADFVIDSVTNNGV
ncbi:hypothetical protein COU15_00585 [Candidatus Kaiserbacteria bacterium CG10_big_fil_rev_8_21_14_0_10_45_20]|uniref:Uncharacterized protein n=1 Tax=Candidatus Kaiserbacteria bacterium CG10_big_fil_rev_8_21_14_0_10_45_20 TaxID=1974607 RepID=A0A2H0UGC9_9BACT|nr:MAG: hypothetical protein COU15_00585 [Candidatus Kaiserbacteria bacterium CG10_big_fil_rev_8_21_14_0_10_45_20]